MKYIDSFESIWWNNITNMDIMMVLLLKFLKMIKDLILVLGTSKVIALNAFMNGKYSQVIII